MFLLPRLRSASRCRRGRLASFVRRHNHPIGSSMASCATCGTTILFGGTKDGSLRFCNTNCQSKGAMLSRAAQVSDSEAFGHARRLHTGPCPKCSGSGPVDIHMSYRVWSALVMTQWQSRSQISCRSCGVKSQLGNIAFSAVLGWWGFPWGLIMTPIQIIRTLFVLVSPPNPIEPSPKLIHASKLQIATTMAVPSAMTPA